MGAFKYKLVLLSFNPMLKSQQHNGVIKSRLTQNPYLVFSPFLFYYAYYIVRHRWPALYGDETRYIGFANNLLHGFYSPPLPHINLWNGPGYPVLLMPFLFFHLKVIYIPLINALFNYLSVVFLYQSLRYFVTHQLALIFALLWAVYPNMLSLLSSIYTEPFTAFIISAFIYSLVLLYIRKNKRYLVITGLLLGYLALVKIIFGYVLLLCLVICLALLLFKKAKGNYLRSVYILSIAFALTAPYLIYTYSLTGKVLYWGNSGGMSLYWMSSPYDDEVGDWKPFNLSNSQFPLAYRSAEGDSILRKNHGAEFNFILKHNEIEQDALFKKIAVANIKKSPKKFIRNYFYNISRLLFNFPYSYTYQDAGIIGNIITGSIILWASLIAAVFSLFNWCKMAYPVKFSLLITLVYLLITAALSAYPRQLDVVVPVFIFWIAMVTSNLLKRLNATHQAVSI